MEKDSKEKKVVRKKPDPNHHDEAKSPPIDPKTKMYMELFLELKAKVQEAKETDVKTNVKDDTSNHKP